MKKPYNHEVVYTRTCNQISLVWATIYCELEMEKWDLNAGVGWWQNSNSTTN